MQSVVQMPHFPLDPNGSDPRKKSNPVGERHHRLFFMLRPTTEAASEALEIAQAYRNAHSLTEPSRPRELLHVTLNGIGAYRRLPQDIVFGAEQVAATVRARPFDLVLDEVISFSHPGEPQAFVICSRQENEALLDLRRQIQEGLYEAGLPYNLGGHLTPHMTLLYDRKTVLPEKLNRPVQWNIREFLLIHSIYGKSEHNVVGRWPLLG
ncbi:2'-5' RNA ligase family protein [Rhizobium sp. WYJ-E13]|uniref:2'-5' RNA ligase family protein n=1 Tax=Rhizobium sp. WYJ-E13 TaxID=2849093 RepID=UPI001C1EBDF2|nr:2'-5' RNA ligase family protein [Rhizobium sp. WYJ-E13]QWW68068.1 2'-5' RNA ligase family protein [Rhizobium sp. WYJ-E13]